jgi:hypothetical protein
MVRLVGGVARCIPVATQHATIARNAQQVAQQPRNSGAALRSGYAPLHAQQPTQQARNIWRNNGAVLLRKSLQSAADAGGCNNGEAWAVPPTTEQAAELQRIVPEVCRLTDDADVDGALARALAHPGDALTCYRALLTELAPPPPTVSDGRDDRRPCTQCANLSRGGHCVAAWRGLKIGNAGRDYHPSYPEQPRRCEGYTPGPDDDDRRSGIERWPDLLPSAGTAARVGAARRCQQPRKDARASNGRGA